MVLQRRRGIDRDGELAGAIESRVQCAGQAAEQFERYTGVRPSPELIAEASAYSRQT